MCTPLPVWEASFRRQSQCLLRVEPPLFRLASAAQERLSMGVRGQHCLQFRSCCLSVNMGVQIGAPALALHPLRQHSDIALTQGAD